MLGKIRGKALSGPGKWEITQGTPEWVQKAMLRVKREDPERWAKIAETVGPNHEFRKVMNVVDEVDSKMASYISAQISGGMSQNQAKKLKAMIENFVDRDIIRGVVNNENLVIDAEQAIGRNFHFVAVNLTGKKVRYVEDIIASFEQHSGGAIDVAERIVTTRFHVK